MPDAEQLTELLADLDRDPDGYTTKGTIAAMIRAAWGPGAPADPQAWEPCECGCNETAECPCDEPAPAEETGGCHRCNGSGVIPQHDGEDVPCTCRPPEETETHG